MYLPEGCTLRPVASNEANGEPAMAVSAPVVALIENPSMSPLFPNAALTYRKLPPGPIASPVGAKLVVTVAPAIAVAAPVAESMLKPVTLLDPLLATYRNLLPGSMAAATGLFPVGNVPAGVNPFGARSVAKPENWLEWAHSTYANFPEGVFARAVGPLQLDATSNPGNGLSDP